MIAASVVYVRERDPLSRPDPPIPRDPEFDPMHGVGPRPSADVVAYYQRLLVNPFLGAAAGAILGLIPIPLFRKESLFLGVVFCVAAVFLTFAMIQYHCLDCGKTDAYRRWRGHACRKVQERWLDPDPHRLGFPSPTRQLVFWILTLGIAGFSALIMSRRP